MDAGDHRAGNANIRQAQLARNHIDDCPAYDQEIKEGFALRRAYRTERMASSIDPGNWCSLISKSRPHAAKIL